MQSGATVKHKTMDERRIPLALIGGLVTSVASVCWSGGPASAKTIRASCETLEAGLREARPGDVVRLSNTTTPCPRLVVPAGVVRKAAPGVTLEGESVEGTAISGLNMGGWNNITVRGLTILGGVDIGGAQNVRLEKSRILGKTKTWETEATDNAIRIRGAKNVVIADNLIQGWGHGIAWGQVDGVDMMRNRIEHIRWDGIRGGNASSNVRIVGNLLINFAKVKAAHLDAIQGFTRTPQPVRNLEIRDNVYDSGETGAARQFIFLQSGAGYENLIIEGNAGFGVSHWAIAAQNVRSGRITSNYTQALTGYNGKSVTPNASPGVVVENNTIGRPTKATDRKKFVAWLREKRPDGPAKALLR